MTGDGDIGYRGLNQLVMFLYGLENRFLSDYAGFVLVWDNSVMGYVLTKS